MAEEDFKEGFIKFGNSAVYFIFDIVSYFSFLLCPIFLVFYLRYSVRYFVKNGTIAMPRCFFAR
jgi:hypothetical protein